MGVAFLDVGSTPNVPMTDAKLDCKEEQMCTRYHHFEYVFRFIGIMYEVWHAMTPILPWLTLLYFDSSSCTSWRSQLSGI